MTDAGLLYIIRRLLSFRTKTEARAFISKEVGVGYAEIATDLAHRLEYHRREIADHLELKSLSHVHRMLGRLEERGKIKRLPRRARAIEVIE